MRLRGATRRLKRLQLTVLPVAVASGTRALKCSNSYNQKIHLTRFRSVHGPVLAKRFLAHNRQPLQLWPKRKSPTARHPIAVFDIKSGEPDSLGEIRIYEPEMPIDALLSQTKQGDQIATSPAIMNSPSQPTDLLDTAVLAWIAYRSFNTGGSLVKSLEFRDL